MVQVNVTASDDGTIPHNLIRLVGSTDPTCLEDLLLVMAKNVEATLRAAGAKPGTDYNHRDLFTMALPFAVEVWKKSDGQMTFVTDNF